jgi:hypothetical protein
MEEQGVFVMHPISPAVAAMAAEISATARRASRAPIDPAELEHYTHDVLADLARSRPRVIDYLPELALNQVLARLGMRERLARFRPTNRLDATQDLTAQAADICRSSRQDCWPVPGTDDGKQVCRCSGRTPAASAWYARLPWRAASGAEAPA